VPVDDDRGSTTNVSGLFGLQIEKRPARFLSAIFGRDLWLRKID